MLILNNKGTMVPINKMNDAFTAPYGSGVYRVGTDIPEGTYQLIVGDGANDYSACYVMSDLNFDEDSSYLYSDYFVKGDNPGTRNLYRALQHADEARWAGIDVAQIIGQGASTMPVPCPNRGFLSAMPAPHVVRDTKALCPCAARC